MEDKLELLIKTRLMKKYYGIDFSSFTKWPFRLKEIVFCGNIFVKFYHLNFTAEEIKNIIKHKYFMGIYIEEYTDNIAVLKFGYDVDNEPDNCISSAIEDEYAELSKKAIGFINTLEM